MPTSPPASPPSPLAVALTRARRVLLRRRRLAVGLLAGLAVLVALRALAPPPPPSALATVAAHDLAAGVRIGPGDLRTVRVARDLMPAQSSLSPAAAVGQVVAAPVGEGEVLAEGAVVGASLLAGYGAEMVAAPVRVPDADVAALLSPGDRIDVFAAQANLAQPASLVAADVAVIAVPRPPDDHAEQGALIVVAATSEQAARLAQAVATAALAVAIRS